MKDYRHLEVGDYVRILCGPRKDRIGQVTNRTMVGIYVHPAFMYDGEVEYVSPEEAMLWLLENA